MLNQAAWVRRGGLRPTGRYIDKEVLIQGVCGHRPSRGCRPCFRGSAGFTTHQITRSQGVLTRVQRFKPGPCRCSAASSIWPDSIAWMPHCPPGRGPAGCMRPGSSRLSKISVCPQAQDRCGGRAGRPRRLSALVVAESPHDWRAVARHAPDA